MINGLSDFNHPTQAICDVFTMLEHLPPGKRLEDCTLVFIGDRTNVCSSSMFIAVQLGMDFIHAAPPAYQSPAEWVRSAEQIAARVRWQSSGSPTTSRRRSPTADFVYTDLWWWVDQEDRDP